MTRHSAKYYRILGLEPGASEAEVKRAYRKLAMQFHPDRNANPGAAEQFIALTEAYEILINQRVAATSSKREATKPPASPEEIVREQEERMRAARERYARKQAEEELENEMYFQRISQQKPYRFFLRVMQLCALTSILLITDFAIPGKIEEVKVIRCTIGTSIGGMLHNRIIGIELETNERLWLDQSARHKITQRPLIRIERSLLFGEIKRIAVRQGSDFSYVNQDFSLYSTFPLIPLLFLIPVIGWLIKSRSLAYSLLFHGTVYLYSPGIVVFYLLNNRLIHLLSFNWF